MIASDFISNLKIPANDSDSKIPELKDEIVKIVFHYLQSYTDDKKELARKTLQGFSSILKIYQEKCKVSDFSEDVVQLIKMYLKYAHEFDNQHYVNIMKIGFELKKVEKLTENDVSKISSKYWNIFQSSISSEDGIESDEIITFEQTYRAKKSRSHQIDAICVILENKSNAEFMALLNEIYVAAMSSTNNEYPLYISKISNLAQCQLQKDKRIVSI